MNYYLEPTKSIDTPLGKIQSFLSLEEQNIDINTVESFGNEWGKFNNFSEDEINKIGDDYFDIIDSEIINSETIALDVGCGSGRWCKYLAPRVKFIEAIDPSTAIIDAVIALSGENNVRLCQASESNIPFKDNSFDFVFSLGVLHHIPNTQQGIKNCVNKIKPGGWFLIYLYYKLENRGIIYRQLFNLSTLVRKIVSNSNKKTKFFISDFIAVTIYIPFALLSRFINFLRMKKLSQMLPLAYYRDKSFTIIRNDSLDRFGTPLEKRFTKSEINQMLTSAGLTNIKFSENKPYWHAIGQKK